jgi:alpha-L-fucosidase
MGAFFMNALRVRVPLVLLYLFAAMIVASPAQAAPTDPDRTAWWRQAKFGMFIHWGIYSVPADSTKGLGEWYMHDWRMQAPEYERFAARFNPTGFDAREWVRIAKSAGMRYITITSKHHDGFCMFDSKLTKYDIVDGTPFRRDPLAELAEECRRQGVKLCFYYSIMDWRHPDYLPRRQWEQTTRPAEGADFSRYLTYMKGQLTELLTRYGDIGVVWFDGGWEGNATKHRSAEVVEMLRSLRPGILVNDRINLPGDFATPEQTIPAGALPDGRLWETCMTMNKTWGFAKNDHEWKPAEELVRKLIDIASKGGNFLLNVGPTAEGKIPPESVERLAAVGRWMRRNGASIYGTTQGPLPKLTFDGRCTRKDDRLYLHVFQWPADGIVVSGLASPVTRARLLDGGGRVETKTETNAAGVSSLRLMPPKKLDPIATVVELRLAEAAR